MNTNYLMKKKNFHLLYKVLFSKNYFICCDPKQKIFTFKLGGNEKNKNSFVFFNKQKA